jgi:hypothetical protein
MLTDRDGFSGTQAAKAWQGLQGVSTQTNVRVPTLQ